MPFSIYTIIYVFYNLYPITTYDTYIIPMITFCFLRSLTLQNINCMCLACHCSITIHLQWSSKVFSDKLIANVWMWQFDLLSLSWKIFYSLIENFHLFWMNEPCFIYKYKYNCMYVFNNSILCEMPIIFILLLYRYNIFIVCIWNNCFQTRVQVKVCTVQQ